MPLLEGLSDNKLRSFAWTLDTCIPKEILGPSGYLARKQSQIETLQLITDGACDYDFLECPIDLSSFKLLKSFSWSGIRSPDKMKALAKVLNSNAAHLVKLELDLIHWELAASVLSIKYYDKSNFFTRNIFEPSPSGTRSMFPALRALSLSGVSFLSAEKDIAAVFDFSLLHSLKLRLCPGWSDFFRHAICLTDQLILSH